jgi:hypothetical protein
MVPIFDPDYPLLLELAQGMRVLTAQDFVANGIAPKPLRSRYLQVAPAVNKLVQASWETGLVFIVRKETAERFSERLHYSPMHWTTNAFKPQGRQLIDSSDDSQGHPLNSDAARELLESHYGKIVHPTLFDIVGYILEAQQRLVPTLVEGDELVLFKADLKGAFTLLNVSPSDTSLFACELTDNLVLIYPTGSFGWTGTPFCFQVITRQLVTLLRRRMSDAVVWAYVDDIMGICRRSDLLRYQEVIREVCTGLLGPKAMAEDKWASGRTLDFIGWSVSLSSQHVTLSDKNYFKILYGFFNIDVESKESTICRDALERLASWSARYSQVVRQASPFTSVFYAQLALSKHKHIRMTEATKSAIVMWRILLCLSEFDPKSFTRSFTSFYPPTAEAEIYFDASLEGLGFYVMVQNKVIAAAQVCIRCLQLSMKPRYQNFAEFLALTSGMVMLARRGYRDLSVRAIGDSVSALGWATRERFRGIRCTLLAMFFTALGTAFNLCVPETEHVPGVQNVICDNLSRGVTSVEVAFPNLRNEIHLDSGLLTSLVNIVNPTVSESTINNFGQTWASIQSLLNRIRSG